MVIICGYGDTGRKLCQVLQQKYKSQIVVIEKNRLIIEKIIRDGYDCFQGDASNSQILINAGIKYAQGIICTFSDDNLNALCILSAKWLNPEILVHSCASKSQSIKKLKLAGANKVITSPKIKFNLFKLSKNSFKIDSFINSIATFEKNPCIVEINVSDYSFLNNKRLHVIKEITDINIIGLKKNNGAIISNQYLLNIISI